MKTEYTGERERFCLESTIEDITSITEQIWTPLYGEILHAITENNEYDRFTVALERFQRWHGTRWRDYLLDNWKKNFNRSSIPGSAVHVHFCRKSEDDQAAGEGLH